MGSIPITSTNLSLFIINNNEVKLFKQYVYENDNRATIVGILKYDLYRGFAIYLDQHRDIVDIEHLPSPPGWRNRTVLHPEDVWTDFHKSGDIILPSPSSVLDPDKIEQVVDSVFDIDPHPFVTAGTQCRKYTAESDIWTWLDPQINRTLSLPIDDEYIDTTDETRITSNLDRL